VAHFHVGSWTNITTFNRDRKALVGTILKGASWLDHFGDLPQRLFTQAILKVVEHGKNLRVLLEVIIPVKTRKQSNGKGTQLNKLTC
jgi:hypothetical protein